jgi:hypothetical protein
MIPTLRSVCGEATSMYQHVHTPTPITRCRAKKQVTLIGVESDVPTAAMFDPHYLKPNRFTEATAIPKMFTHCPPLHRCRLLRRGFPRLGP